MTRTRDELLEALWKQALEWRDDTHDPYRLPNGPSLRERLAAVLDSTENLTLSCVHQWGAWNQLDLCPGVIRSCVLCHDMQVRSTEPLKLTDERGWVE